MISTRGVKFKFSAGEKVLCYEPDPTKAKVLYESKVLDLVANRDNRGRKVCEYLIHFYGWNSSWDRYVREEFILPFTEENRQLQTKLAEEAALSLKGKGKKKKLPPLIKETLSKKMGAKNDQDSRQKTPSHSNSDAESSEEEFEEREITIDIPEALKAVLDEDFLLITEHNKFIKIPCETNVISILEAYVRHYALNLFCVSPPRNVKSGPKLIPEDVQNKLNICKQTMDGLRIFFDFTLENLLLYRQEKKQYHTIGNCCRPVLQRKSFQPQPDKPAPDDGFSKPSEKVDQVMKECQAMEMSCDEDKDIKNFVLDLPKLEVIEADMRNRLRFRLNVRNNDYDSAHADGETAVHAETNVKQVGSKSPQKQSPKHKPGKKSKCSSIETSCDEVMDEDDFGFDFQKLEVLEADMRNRLRYRLNLRNNHYSLGHADGDSAVHLEMNAKHESKSPQKQSPKHKPGRKSKAGSKTTSTRILRSSDKQKQPATNDELSVTVNVEPIENNCITPKTECPSEPTSPLRKTRKTGHVTPSPSIHQQASPSSVSCDISVPNSPTSSIPNIEHLLSLSASSNYFSSSNSSSQSDLSGAALQGHHYHLVHYSTLLQELLSWHMVPDSWYEDSQPFPSLVYGAHHFLRLFVKLPALMSKMSIKQSKLEFILQIIENFLSFLVEKNHEIFLTSAYVDASEVFPAGSMGML